MQTHVTSNDEKRIKVGDDPSKKPLATEDTQEAIVDCLIWRGRLSRRRRNFVGIRYIKKAR